MDGERVFAEHGRRPGGLGQGARPTRRHADGYRPAAAGARADQGRARTPIGVTFVEKTGARNPLLLKPLRAPVDTVDVRRHPARRQRQITGPFNPTGPGDTASRRRIFTCRPADRRRGTARAPRRIVSTLARRAFRGPVDAADARAPADVLRPGTQARAARSTAACSWRCAASCRIRRSSSAPSATRRRGRGQRRLPRSAIWNWRRGCRSSCGAASRTTSCCAWRSRTGSATPAVLRRAGAPHARRPAGRRARHQLRRSVAAAAEPAAVAART